MNKMKMKENENNEEKRMENEEKMMNKIAKRLIKKCIRQSRINTKTSNKKQLKLTS